MTRLATRSRTSRIAVAFAGAAGIAVTMAGCAGAGTANADGVGGTGGGTAPFPSQSPAATADAGAQYKDGTYIADGAYQTPQSVEKVTVSLTVDHDVVKAVRVSGDPQTSETVHYQGEFIAGISGAIVGQKIEDLSVTRVGGSSLTSAGFNDALAKIDAQAKA